MSDTFRNSQLSYCRTTGDNGRFDEISLGMQVHKFSGELRPHPSEEHFMVT